MQDVIYLSNRSGKWWAVSYVHEGVIVGGFNREQILIEATKRVAWKCAPHATNIYVEENGKREYIRSVN